MAVTGVVILSDKNASRILTIVYEGHLLSSLPKSDKTRRVEESGGDTRAL